jgi:hypothetical protein
MVVIVLSFNAVTFNHHDQKLDQQFSSTTKKPEIFDYLRMNLHAVSLDLTLTDIPLKKQKAFRSS